MEASEEKTMGNGKKGMFKRICVFCGSRSGNRPSFSEAALQLGKQLVRIHMHAYNFILNIKLFMTLCLSFCCSLFLCLLKVERKIDLVYGGGSVGLMGLVSQTVFDGGCHVLG